MESSSGNILDSSYSKIKRLSISPAIFINSQTRNQYDFTSTNISLVQNKQCSTDLLKQIIKIVSDANKHST